MLTTSKKSGYQWMRKLLVLPIAAVTVALFAFSYKKMSAELPLLNPVLNEKILRQNGDTAYYLNGKLSSKNEINNLPSNIIKMMTVLRGKDAEAVSPELKQVVKVETFTGREMLAGSTEDMVKSDTVPKEPEIFSKVEKDAEYPGNWRTFLQNTLNGEVAVKNGARPGNYTVIIQFIVDKDGTLSNVKALTKHGYGIEDEAIRVIQASGKWIPAMQKGHPVKAYRRQPIIFQIREVINEGTVDINWNQKDTTTTKPQVISEPEIFTKVEKEAEYPGNWTRFLEYNLDGKVAIQNRAPAGKYTTITQFIVNKDGTISDVKAIRKVGYGLDDEAVRVIKKSGKWKPAVQNGREVKAYRRQPITFMVRNP